MVRRRAAAHSWLKAVLLWTSCGGALSLAAPSWVHAQDFSVPRMLDEDDGQATKPTKKKPRKKLDIEDDYTPVAPPEDPRRPKTVAKPDDPPPPPPPDLPGPPVPGRGDRTPPPPPAVPDAGPTVVDAGPRVEHVPPPPPSVQMPAPTGAALTHLVRAQKGVALQKVAYQDLLDIWETRRKALEKAPGDSQKHLLSVLSTVRAMGGGSPGGAQAPDVALALTEEAHTWMDKLEADRGLAISEVAAQVAPSISATHLAVARARYLKNPSDLGPIWNSVVAAVTAEVLDLRLMVRWILAVALALAGTLLALLLATTLLNGGRRLRLLAHDVGHVLPLQMRRGAGWVITALVVCVPIMFRAGPLPTLLWWVVLTWRYWDDGEHVLGGLCVTLSLALPFVLDAAAPLMVFPQSAAYAMYLGQTDLSRTESMRERVDKAPMDAISLGVSGLMHKRAGNLDAARAALEHSLRLDPKNPWVHNNLGCTLAAAGDMDRAQQEFDLSQDVLSLHNAATLHNMMGRTGAARDAWEAADKANHAMAQAYRDRSAGAAPRPHNVAFVDSPAPTLALLPMALVTTPESDAVSADVWRRLCPLVPRSLYPAVAVGTLLLLLLQRLLSGRFTPAVACRRCGAPACRACDGKEVDKFHCAQCFNAFMVRGARVEAALKIRKDVQIRRYRGRRQFFTRALSAVWGGLGLLYGGMPARGGLVMLLFSVGTLFGLLLGVLLPDPTGLGSGTMLLRLVVPGLPVLLCWLLGLVMSFRSEP